MKASTFTCSSGGRGGRGGGSRTESNRGEHADIQSLPARVGLTLHSATSVGGAAVARCSATLYSEKESDDSSSLLFLFLWPKSESKTRIELRTGGGGGGGSGLRVPGSGLEIPLCRRQLRKCRASLAVMWNGNRRSHSAPFFRSFHQTEQNWNSDVFAHMFWDYWTKKINE